MRIGDKITFGRNKDCSHKLNDSYVSGLHCKIWHDQKRNELWVKDYRYEVSPSTPLKCGLVP